MSPTPVKTEPESAITSYPSEHLPRDINLLGPPISGDWNEDGDTEAEPDFITTEEPEVAGPAATERPLQPILVSDLGPGIADHDIDTEDEPEPPLEPLRDLGGGFQVHIGLPVCRQRKKTLRQLMEELDKPDGIDLSPAYQRDFVWREERQIGLIDSIFTGWHIPSLIFNKRVDSNVLVCIDGKQRLTSVQRFTQGLIPCLDAHGKKWWFMQNGDTTKGRKYLPQKVKDLLWRKTFLCDEYSGMTDSQEHELFERVQRGNPLTPAEKSRAQKGDWHDLARVFEDSLPGVVALSENKRGAGHDKIISSFVQILEGRKEDNNEVSFVGTPAWVGKRFVAGIHQNPCTDRLKEHLEKVFDRFEELTRFNPRPFTNEGLPPRAVLAPIEFIAIAYMIDQYGGIKRNKELETAIRVMRLRVRERHNHNIMRNNAVWKTLLESMRGSLGSRGETLEKRGDILEKRGDILEKRGAKRPLQEDEEECRRVR